MASRSACRSGLFSSSASPMPNTTPRVETKTSRAANAPMMPDPDLPVEADGSKHRLNGVTEPAPEAVRELRQRASWPSRAAAPRLLLPSGVPVCSTRSRSRS